MANLLVVDDDASTRKMLGGLLSNEQERVFEADSGAVALKILGDDPGPWILLLDLVMPEPDGRSVCQIIRKRFVSSPPYIIVMSARARRSEIADVLRAGADDFIAKPIAPDVLRSRLTVARRHVSRGAKPSRRVLAGLDEGVARGFGELLVRDDDTVGRILFHDHRIAWAHISQDSESFVTTLCSNGVSQEELTAAINEARHRGEGFHKVLQTWGLLSREHLERVLREWIRRRVYTVLRFPNPQVLFVPMHRTGNAQVSFALSEVLSEEDRVAIEAPTLRPGPQTSRGSGDAWDAAFFTPQTPDPQSARLLDAAMGIDGAVSVALINRDTGVCEGWKGQPMNPGLAWSMIQVLNTLTASDEQAEDLLISARQSFHLLRTFRDDASRVCYLVVNRRSGSLGSARAFLADLVQLKGKDRV